MHWAAEYLLELDQVVGLSRAMWYSEIPTLSMTYLQAFTSILGSLAQGLSLGFVSIFMVTVLSLAKPETESA